MHKALYAHQQQIIDADPKQTGLFLGTGSGKTLIAQRLARGTTLVICPKTVHEDTTWGSLTTISKETFRRDHASLPRYDTVILDESHTLVGCTPQLHSHKGVRRPKASQLFWATHDYLRRTRPERLYALTATPIRNPLSVWGIATLLGHDWDFRAFRDVYYIERPIGGGRKIWIPKTGIHTKERLGRAVRKIGYTGRLQDWFDVPEQTWRTVRCPLSPTERATIQALPLEYPDPLVRVGKTHQAEQCASKLDAIDDLLLQYDKVLIFAKYRAQIAEIAASIADRPVFTLTGDTKDRGTLIADAEASPRAAVIAQSSISAGYELPSFHCVIYASHSWSFVDFDQSKGRVIRANHLTGKRLFVNLVSGDIDRAVIKALEHKSDFSEKIYCEQTRSDIHN